MKQSYAAVNHDGYVTVDLGDPREKSTVESVKANLIATLNRYTANLRAQEERITEVQNFIKTYPKEEIIARIGQYRDIVGGTTIVNILSDTKEITESIRIILQRGQSSEVEHDVKHHLKNLLKKHNNPNQSKIKELLDEVNDSPGIIYTPFFDMKLEDACIDIVQNRNNDTCQIPQLDNLHSISYRTYT